MKLYDFFISKFDIEKTISPEIEIDFAISKFQTQVLIDNHARNLKQFHNQNGIKVVLNFKNRPNFSGFDPMHAEAINKRL